MNHFFEPYHFEPHIFNIKHQRSIEPLEHKNMYELQHIDPTPQTKTSLKMVHLSRTPIWDSQHTQLEKRLSCNYPSRNKPSLHLVVDRFSGQSRRHRFPQVRTFSRWMWELWGVKLLDEIYDFYEERKPRRSKKYIVGESRISFFWIKHIERKQQYITQVVTGIVHAGYLI